MENYRVIEIKQSVFADNDQDANQAQAGAEGEQDLPTEFDVIPRQRQDNNIEANDFPHEE